MKWTLALLTLVAAAFTGGCGQEKTPEEIEAEKYPKVQPLTPEEQQRALELSKSRPPQNPQPQ